jgi:hypothetical protein
VGPLPVSSPFADLRSLRVIGPALSITFETSFIIIEQFRRDAVRKIEKLGEARSAGPVLTGSKLKLGNNREAGLQFSAKEGLHVSTQTGLAGVANKSSSLALVRCQHMDVTHPKQNVPDS